MTGVVRRVIISDDNLRTNRVQLIEPANALQKLSQNRKAIFCRDNNRQPEGLWGHMLHDRDYVAFLFILDEHYKKTVVFLYEREILW